MKKGAWLLKTVMTIYVFLEIAAGLLFLYYFNHARVNQKLDFMFLVFLFAVLVENLSIVIFAGREGGYVYNTNFNLFTFETPLFVILFWVSIIYSAYLLVDRIAGSERQFLFLTPVYVMIMDIVMDVVATSMGLWTWIGFESGDGFYGVPASNYLGWLLISFSFILVYRGLYLPKKNKLKAYYTKALYISTPFLAIALFLAIMWPLYKLKCVFELCDKSQYFLCLPVLILFVILAIGSFRKPKDRPRRKEILLFNIRVFLHLFSLFGLIYLDLYKELSLIIVFSLILIIEAYILYRYCK